MIVSHTTERFRKAFSELPHYVKKEAKNAYKQFREDPYHPSLHFKKVHQEKPVYSARVSDNQTFHTGDITDSVLEMQFLNNPSVRR